MRNTSKRILVARNWPGNLLSKRNTLFAFLIVVAIVPSGVVAWDYLRTFFAPKVIYPTDPNPLDVVAGDINSDGHLDLITANREGRSLSVFLGNGSGSLMPIEAVPTELGATSLALADLNHDSILDVVVSVCNYGCNKNSIKIFRGLGDGRFVEHDVIAVTGVPYNIAIADFDNDGWLDIAASDAAQHRLMVLRNIAGSGSFEEISLPTAERPIAFAIGDVNQDGYTDLVSANQWGRSCTVYLSFGGGVFSEGIEIPLGELPYAIALAKIDQDNVLDLLVAYSTEPGKIAVYRGLGDGNFSLQQEIEVSDRLVYIYAADFNRDDWVDVLVTRDKQKFASLFLNNGNGTLDSRELEIAAENRIYSLVVTTLNRDRYPDLVTVDWEQDTLSVSLGNEPEG